MYVYNGKRPEDPRDIFVYWINERERIRTLKEQGVPKPWSDDPIFQTVYFCNVKREHDKVTRWLRDNYRLYEFPSLGLYEWAIAIARLLNWPPSLGLIKPNLIAGDVPGMGVALRQLEQDGEKIWGGAYVVTTHGIKTDKLSYLLRIAQEALEYPNLAYAAGTLAGAHERIKKWEGFSDFMAAQVVADLKNSPGHPLCAAPDWWDWAAPGPGSIRGLEWYGIKKTPRLDESFSLTLSQIRENIRQRIPMQLCLQDLQNCFCEYDKYMRVLNNTGRSKRKYEGI